MLLALLARTTVIVAPRQSGKSFALAVLSLHRAFAKRGQRVLVRSDARATRLVR